MRYLIFLMVCLYGCTDLNNSFYYNDKVPVLLEVNNIINGEKVTFCYNLWTLDDDPQQIECFYSAWLEKGRFKVYAPESGFCVTILAYANGSNSQLPTHKCETEIRGPVIACDWGETEHVYELNPLVSFE